MHLPQLHPIRLLGMVRPSANPSSAPASHSSLTGTVFLVSIPIIEEGLKRKGQTQTPKQDEGLLDGCSNDICFILMPLTQPPPNHHTPSDSRLQISKLV